MKLFTSTCKRLYVTTTTATAAIQSSLSSLSSSRLQLRRQFAVSSSSSSSLLSSTSLTTGKYHYSKNYHHSSTTIGHYCLSSLTYSSSSSVVQMSSKRHGAVRCSSSSTPTTGNYIGTNVTEAINALRECDCVCFDVDSTVIQEEGIDVLADYLGMGQQVAAVTKQAMDGGMKFQDALSLRLSLLRPSKQQIQRCMEQHPFKLTSNIDTLISILQNDLNKHVYLVSGGFRIMIEPIAVKLNIPKERIIANTILFDTDGLYNGFDTTEPTSADMGKARAMEQIIIAHEQKIKNSTTTSGNKKIITVMVGDGMTDTQAKPPATAFIGFGGVARRPAVESIADWYVLDFQDVIDQLVVVVQK